MHIIIIKNNIIKVTFLSVHIVDRASFCPCPFCPLRYATIYILFVLYIVFDFVLDVLEGGGGLGW
jgi:hypothetical protein